MKRILLYSLFATLCGASAPAQWSDDPATNNRITMVGQSEYGREVETTADGTTYVVTIHPEGGSVLTYYLQIVSPDGKPAFPEEGLSVSSERNRSWVAVNKRLLVDKDGNAIVITSDCRNASSNTQSLGYTVYKIDTDGNVLWQTDLADGQVYDSTAAMNACQTTDGGYVFAYESYYDDGSTKIHIEKLNADGEKSWDEPLLLADESKNYQYPYIVDAGDNQTMLIYLAGTNQDIIARLLDFDGSSVWGEDTVVYRGGFDSTPAWTYIEVSQAPEGGAFITWRDDRYYENQFSNYISYVKNDGSLGFPGGSDALKISYADDYSRMNPKIVYDDEQKCIFAVYRQFNQGLQSWNGIFMQKISLDGELLWDAEGKAVVDIQNQMTAAYATVQLAGETDIAVFWQTNQSEAGVMSYAMKYDTDGNPLWDNPLSFTTTVSEKTNLLSSPLIDGKYWLLNWEDFRDYDNLESSVLYMQRVNIDGTLGTPDNTGITEAVAVDSGAVTVYNTTGQRLMTLPSADVLNSAGLNAGLYIIRDSSTGRAHKKIIK